MASFLYMRGQESPVPSSPGSANGGMASIFNRAASVDSDVEEEGPELPEIVEDEDTGALSVRVVAPQRGDVPEEVWTGLFGPDVAHYHLATPDHLQSGSNADQSGSNNTTPTSGSEHVLLQQELLDTSFSNLSLNGSDGGDDVEVDGEA